MEEGPAEQWLIGRRNVLALGVGAVALVGLPSVALAQAASPVGFVVDTRFPNQYALARPRGAWLHAIDGDVTALWYERLDLAWRNPQSGEVAGVTGSDALFVLEHLAWDRQRRVLLRQTVQDAGGPVPLVRWLIAPRHATA